MGPENFAPIRPTVQKLQHFFEVTDGQTKMNLPSTTTNFFFCIYVRGREGNSTHPTKFLPLHFVKDKVLTPLLVNGIKLFKVCEDFKKLNSNTLSEVMYLL